MSDFIAHLLETAAIQANSQRMFEIENTESEVEDEPKEEE